MIWTKNDNSCVKLIEPEDGVLGWCGSIELKRFAPGFGDCGECPVSETNREKTGDVDPNKGVQVSYVSPLALGYELQKQLKPEYITGVTLVIFDRVEQRYILAKGASSYADGHVCHSEVPFCLEDECFASLKITKDIPGEPYHHDVLTIKKSGEVEYSISDEALEAILMVDLRTFLGTMSLKNNRFDLRQIRLHF